MATFADMPAPLPPELDYKLRTIARSHNRYLVWIVGVWFILTVAGLKISQTQRTLGFSGLQTEHIHTATLAHKSVIAQHDGW